MQQTVLVFEVRTESGYAALHPSSHLVFHHGHPAGYPLPVVQLKQKTEGHDFFGVCGGLWRGTDGLEQRAKGAKCWSEIERYAIGGASKSLPEHGKASRGLEP